MEAQFKAYLRTPEGLAAMEAELERVGKSLDKRTSNAASAKEREYVRNIMLSKDKVPAVANEDFSLSYSSLVSWGGKLTQYASSWIVPAATAPSASKLTKGKLKRAATTSRSGGAVKKQGGEGTAKQRITTGAGAGPLSSELDEDVEGGKGHTPSSPTDNSSRATNDDDDTSENDSISSDDSDVKEVTAPLFNEFSSWLSWENGQRIWNRATKASTRVVSSTNHLLEQYEVKQRTVQALEAVGEKVIPIMSNISTTVMDTTYSALQGCFNRLNPLMITFVEQVVDGNAIVRAPPPVKDEESPSVAGGADGGAAYVNEEEEHDVEMHSQQDDTDRALRALPTGPNSGSTFSFASAPKVVKQSSSSAPSNSVPVPYPSLYSSSSTVLQPPASMQITASPRGFLPPGPPPNGPSPRAPISSAHVHAPAPASAAAIAAAMASVEPLPVAHSPIATYASAAIAPVADRKSTVQSDGWKTLEFSPVKSASDALYTDTAVDTVGDTTVDSEVIENAHIDHVRGDMNNEEKVEEKQEEEEETTVIGSGDIEISVPPTVENEDSSSKGNNVDDDDTIVESSASLLEEALHGDTNEDLASDNALAPTIAATGAASSDTISPDAKIEIVAGPLVDQDSESMSGNIESASAASAPVNDDGVSVDAKKQDANAEVTPEPSAATTPVSSKTDNNNNITSSSMGNTSSQKKNKKKKNKK